MIKRAPAVSGQFYYGRPSRLRGQVEECVTAGVTKERVIAVLSPHAGLMYSGSVAGAVYSSIEFPRTFVLLGPNHTGLGAAISIMPAGQWEIPTALFTIDETLSRKIMEKSAYVSDNTQAHLFEHSLEVQLPFISYFSEDVQIVPITVMKAPLEVCSAVGNALAEAIREVPQEVVIVASSDMSHYVSDDRARRLDHLAIEEILGLNPEGLYETVERERISMCGYLPATIMLYAAKALGAQEARLVKYATSGEVSGDYDHVVGYAGIIVK